MSISAFRPGPLTIVSLLATGLAGCTGLPAAAPTPDAIENHSEPDWLFYLVKMTPDVLPFLTAETAGGFPSSFRSFNYQPSLALRPGDVVAMTVFEAGGTTLFSTPSTVPQQIIEPSGRLVVPFVGAVNVAGMTPLQASDMIATKLAPQTVKPQVVVTVVASASNIASVGGDVNKSGPVPLTLRGERVLDAIDFAGGVKYPINEMDVRITRGRSSAVVPLDRVVKDTAQNVKIRANDEIVAIHNPKTFTVLGATNKPAQYNFDTPSVTMAEAVARAGGAIDTVGDPAGVYLFRREPTRIATQILDAAARAGNVTSNLGHPIRTTHPAGSTTLMVYKIDLATSDGYFMAQKLQMRDKDIIVMSNAIGTQLQKLTTIVRGFTGILFDVGASASGF